MSSRHDVFEMGARDLFDHQSALPLQQQATIVCLDARQIDTRVCDDWVRDFHDRLFEQRDLSYALSEREHKCWFRPTLVVLLDRKSDWQPELLWSELELIHTNEATESLSAHAAYQKHVMQALDQVTRKQRSVEEQRVAGGQAASRRGLSAADAGDRDDDFPGPPRIWSR